jgi:hypothetical protein
MPWKTTTAVLPKSSNFQPNKKAAKGGDLSGMVQGPGKI